MTLATRVVESWSPVRLSGRLEEFHAWERSVMGNPDYFLIIRIILPGEKVKFDAWAPLKYTSPPNTEVLFDAWVPESFLRSLYWFRENHSSLTYHPQMTYLDETARAYQAFFRDNPSNFLFAQVRDKLRDLGFDVEDRIPHQRSTWVVSYSRLVPLYWDFFRYND